MNKNLSLNKYFDFGSGDETIVLIHGVENSGKFWKGLDKQLAKKRRVISIDLLGFGHSKSAENFTLNDNVVALENTLSDVKTPIIIVGHSMGTFVALEFAKRNKEKIKRIVLTSPVFILKSEDHHLESTIEKLQSLMLDNIYILREGLLEIIRRANILVRASVKPGISLMPSIKSVEDIVENQDPISQLNGLTDKQIIMAIGRFDLLVINKFAYQVALKYDNVKLFVFNVFHEVPHYRKKEVISLIENGEL